MAEIDRQSLIDLLNRFDDADDAVVTAAAREVQQTLSQAGLSWDEILLPDEPEMPYDEADDDTHSDEDEDEDEFQVEDDVEDGEDDDEEGESESDDADNVIPISAAEARDDLALIDRILRDLNVSEDTREELEGYREDIEAGEFTASDRNYLQALQKRLSKK